MRWLRTAALAAAGTTILGAVLAQTPPHHPAAQAQTPVSPLVYRNVFAETPSGVVQDRSDWKRANAEVGQYLRGHADVLKRELQSGTGTGVDAGAQAPGASAKPAHGHAHGTTQAAPNGGQR